MTAANAAEAEAQLERLDDLAPGIRAIAVLSEGELLAATSAGKWAERSGRLWDLADAEFLDERAASQMHIGTDDGEVFGLRDGDLELIAVTDRLVLASLVFWDLRAIARGMRDQRGL